MNEAATVRMDVWMLVVGGILLAYLTVAMIRGAERRKERNEKIERSFNDLRDVLMEWMG